MTTKLYYYIATGNNYNAAIPRAEIVTGAVFASCKEIVTGAVFASCKEIVIGSAYLAFEKNHGFKPVSVEAIEISKEDVRRAMPGALSAHIDNGQRSVAATLANDTIVFHVAFKSTDPASIAHAMAEVEEQPTEEEFMKALKIVMGNCPFLKDFKND